MKSRGHITNISLNWKTRKPEVTVEVDARPDEVEKLKDRDLSVELKQYRQKRSQDANAYYWTLCTKVATALRHSTAYIHNVMLRRYGQPETVDDRAMYVVIPNTDEAAKAVDEAETYHLKPTSQVRDGLDGITYRTYMMLRGSHSYDTKEMSRLIDGIVSEAKELGIETMTPNQLAEMMALYEKKHRGGDKG